ncbi:MAG: ABC transporter substrate-binding protein, partial [Acidimicrobiales bacterium]
MSNLNRRQFLGHGAALSALLAAGPTLLAACSDDRGSDNPATGTNATPVGVASVQLSGAKDAQFAGSYLADANGYYTKAGFEKVDLLPGGPDIGVETVVGAGTALLGYT